MMNPRRPRCCARFSDAVWATHWKNFIGGRLVRSFFGNMISNASASASAPPIVDPTTHPERPLVNSAGSSEASASACSAACAVKMPMRPMLRRLCLGISFSFLSSAGAPTRLFRPVYSCHPSMNRTPLCRCRIASTIEGTSVPSAQIAPRPVITTRLMPGASG